MRALSIRQPWAELILRGVKTVEYRSRPTRIVGERFWIYAGKGPFVRTGGILKPEAGSRNGKGGAAAEGRIEDGGWRMEDSAGASSPSSILYPRSSPLSSDNLRPTHGPPGWMWALAEALILSGEPLPRGVIVGTAVIERVSRGRGGDFHWHLVGVERLERPRRPVGHPQPVWFLPFGDR